MNTMPRISNLRFAKTIGSYIVLVKLCLLDRFTGRKRAIKKRSRVTKKLQCTYFTWLKHLTGAQQYYILHFIDTQDLRIVSCELLCMTYLSQVSWFFRYFTANAVISHGR